MESRGNEKLPISIPEFYKGKSVFITGFTGVLGKLIVEKLLYSCPEVDKIYVLIRRKKGADVKDRLKRVFDSLAFKRVHEKYPGVLENKVIAIGGDVLNDSLGLSKSDEELLRREVSIIFHGAASVKFDDPINAALEINTRPTIKMINLALSMPHLQCFCHISTAYTNCDKLRIKEELYPPKADWNDSLIINKKIDSSSFEILSKKYIGALPNTYTFTKSLAEDIINDYKERLPVVIVRPSIVIPSWEEPVAGWSDNIYGAVGVIVGAFLGIIRTTPIDKNAKTNFIPSDIIVNSIITVAWKTALNYKPNHKNDSVTVYNGCSPKSFNLTNKELIETYKAGSTLQSIERDGINNIWFCTVNNDFLYKIDKIFKEVFSAMFIDLILKIIKKEPVLTKVRRKIHMAERDLKHFSKNSFQFDNDNFLGLVKDMNPEDREAFGWEFHTCNINTIFHNSFHMMASTVLKPLYNDLDNNRKLLKGLNYIDKSSFFLSWFTVIGTILYISNIPQTFFNLIF